MQTSVCFLVVLLGLLCAGRSRMMRDPGTLWHVVAGERMLVEHMIIRTDSFSFTHDGDEWLAQQWLAECAMAVIDRAAGLDGLLLISCAAIAGIFAFLYMRATRAGLPFMLTVLFLLIIAAGSSYHFMPRPHLATLVFMTAGIALFCDIEGGQARANRLLIIPPIMILWTNLHGGALGGLASLILIALGLLLRPRFLPRQSGESNPPALVIAVTACLSIVAILVNPFGASLPRVWLGLMDSSVLPKVIIEHAPTDLLSGQGAIILFIAAVYFLVFAKTCRTTFKITWLLPAVWFILALSRIRHAPIFALISAVVILDMIPHSPFATALAKMRSVGNQGIAAPSRSFVPLWFGRFAARPTAFAFTIVLLSLGLQTAHIPLPVLGANWAKLDPVYWPVEATARLNKQLASNSDARRVFNDMRYGGYLISNAPTARIYIDDRCELYRDAGLLRYVELLKHPERIEGEAVYQDIDYALVRSESPHAKYLSQSVNWSVLHQDRTAALFQRNASTAATKSRL